MPTNDDPNAQHERRTFFRVDDVVPVVLKNCQALPGEVKGKICSITCGPFGQPPEPDDSQGINPRLWEVLVDIQAKLNLILEKLSLQEQGLGQVAGKPVSLSASGLCLNTDARFEVGEFLEIQMLLNAPGPVWVMVYGQVTRSEPLPGGLRRIAIFFSDMDETVRDVITQHALRRQREMIRKKRGYDDPWVPA